MGHASTVRANMQVVGADGVPVGTVEEVQHHRIKLTPTGAMGEGGARSHYISLGLVAGVEGETVRLSATGANVQFLEEEDTAE